MTAATDQRNITPEIGREILAEIGLTPVKFVRLMKKSDRTAVRWFGKGPIYGPARAVLSAWQQLHRYGLLGLKELGAVEGDDL